MRVVLHIDVVCYHHEGDLLPDVQAQQNVHHYVSIP